MAKKLTYKDSGVDTSANDRMVQLIKASMRSTYGPRVIMDRHGAFAGLFRLDYDERLFKRNYRNPVLVGCSDGVGSKVLVAIKAGIYDTVGIDMVAMNVNDMITMGAEPLFLLDYLAVHKLDPTRVAEIVDGVAQGCRQSGCALLGGETAELPDLYKPTHFDLAGCAVGVVERDRIVDGSAIEPDDVAIGLASNGPHSTGFSLIRRLIFKEHKLKLTEQPADLDGMTVAQALLAPTRIYVQSIISVLGKYRVKRPVRGMAHITGGGLADNVARVIPDGLGLTIKKGSWPIPPVFNFIQNLGVDEDEMYRVFNMGIGYVLVVRPTFAAAIIRRLKRYGEQPHILGTIRSGNGGVKVK